MHSRNNYYFSIRLIAITAIIVGLICLFRPSILKAQTTFKLAAGKDVVVKIKGTSNLNNWTMTSMVSKSQGDFEFDTNNKLVSISLLSFSIPVKSLKSRDKTMDNRTYKLLKVNNFPEIVFKLDSSELRSTLNNEHDFKAKGELSIAGVTKPIILNVNIVVGTHNTVACSGTKKINLSDYGIDPPGLMFDIFKVNEVVTVQFMLVFNK